MSAEDPFQKRSDMKKERVAKNELQHLKNLKRNTDHRNVTFGRGANSIPIGGGPTNPNDRTKKELGYQIHHAKEATASAGKFQKKLKNEKAPKLGIKRKV
jgi:regulator of ribosome biosynthesis